MPKKSSIFDELQRSIANPVPVEQQSSPYAAPTPSVEEVVEPVPAKQLSPAEQFQQELAASGMGASEYLYAKSHPAPKAPDEKALRRQRTLANITDLGLLLTDGIGAVAGGNVNKRTETATGNANTQAERLQQVYDRQKQQYGDNIYNARAKDNDFAKEIELRKAQRLQKESDLKEERTYAEGRDKAKAVEQRVLYGIKTDAEIAKDKKDKEFTATQKQLDRNAADERARKSGHKTTDKPNAAELKQADEDAMWAAYREQANKYPHEAPNPRELTVEKARTFVRSHDGYKHPQAESSTTQKDYSANKRTTTTTTPKKDFSKFKR